ncbi:hypothetical protein WAI453_000354 [Rhynchosporium graminicola]
MNNILHALYSTLFYFIPNDEIAVNPYQRFRPQRHVRTLFSVSPLAALHSVKTSPQVQADNYLPIQYYTRVSTSPNLTETPIHPPMTAASQLPEMRCTWEIYTF